MGKISTLLLLAMMALAFVGCSGKSDVEDVSHLASTASFDVTSVTAKKVDPIYGSGQSLWSEIPLKNSITFQTCLNDMTLQVPLQDERVSIQTPYGEYIKESNSQGCLSWDEDFSFSFFSQEDLSNYPIKIKGLSGHFGEESISLKINPWSQSQSTVVYDPRFDELPTIQSNNEKSGSEELDAFIIKDLSLNFLPSKYDQETGTPYYEFQFNARAQGQRRDLQGNPTIFDLQKGHFQVSISLIEERNGSYQKLSETFSEIKPQAGLIQKTLKFHFGRGFQHHPDSTFYIKVEMEPIGLSNTTIGSLNRMHQGIMPLSSLNGTSQGILASLETFPGELVEARLKSEVILREEEAKAENGAGDSNVTDGPIAGDIDRDEQNIVHISSVNLNKGLLLPNQNLRANSRLRRMPVELCLVDSLAANNGRALPQTKVSFSAFQSGEKDTEEVREAFTNTNGCFQSFIILTYDYLGCDSFKTINYQVEVKEGRYQGITASGSMAVNPFISNDFFYDLNLAVRPPETHCEKPKLVTPRFQYKAEGLKRDGFRLNKNLHLSLEKRYSFEFDPKFFRGNSYQEVTSHQPLYFGEFDMKISVFSPTIADVNYYQFDSREWTYITSSQSEVQVDHQGKVQGEFILPLHLSETLMLGYKNLLLITLSPKDNSLESFTFSVPFYALAQGASLAVSPVDELYLSDEVKKRIAQDTSLGMKIPGLHGNIDESLDNDERPLELYRREYGRLAKKDNERARLIPLSASQFGQIPPLGKASWSEISESEKNKYLTELSDRELKNLANKSGRLPKTYTTKFCRLFHAIGSESLEECLEEPESFIEVTPMSFIENILGTEETHEVEGRTYSAVKARFKSDEQGSIKRGNAFFAAYGDRSSENWGTRTSEAESRSYKYGMETFGLQMFFLGGSEAYESTKEKYRVLNTAKMKAAFNRNYTSRDVIDLTYNSLTLGFTVEKRDCITLESKKEVALAYNICREEAKRTSMEETWFLITDTNMEKHGIISDGNLKGDHNRSQVIRGQQNFNILWDQFESNDTFLVVKELGEKFPGDAYGNYLNRENALPYESQFDHSFPGMIIPESHRPTTSCNDCQDQL